jgi:hypothetical protein
MNIKLTHVFEEGNGSISITINEDGTMAVSARDGSNNINNKKVNLVDIDGMIEVLETFKSMVSK